MSEKILFEGPIVEAINEPGFDKMFAPQTAGHPDNPQLNAPAPGASVQVTPNQQTGNSSGQGNTNTTDIARNAPGVLFSQNIISKTLPAMIGYVQPLNGPGAYVMGLTWKGNTKIADSYNDPTKPTRVTPGTNPGDDPVILRKYIETEIREVNIDITNEAAQDIISLYNNELQRQHAADKEGDKNIFYGIDGESARFFLTYGQQRMAEKINTDFMAWMDKIASVKGTATIKDYSEMQKILGVIGELRETLYKGTRKSGPIWVIVSPRIANYLATFQHATHSSADGFMRGRRNQNAKENGYVITIGDIEVYQSPVVDKKTTDGSETYADQLEAKGVIYAGIKGGPNSSSIIYYPYKEYAVQGGEDYYTGQSNVFYRVRDTWSTNPLDTLNNTQQSVTTPQANKNSLYVVKANITFAADSNLLK